jgi:hypothetical protein
MKNRKIILSKKSEESGRLYSAFKESIIFSKAKSVLREIIFWGIFETGRVQQKNNWKIIDKNVIEYYNCIMLIIKKCNNKYSDKGDFK